MHSRITAIEALLKKCRWEVEQAQLRYSNLVLEQETFSGSLRQLAQELNHADGGIQQLLRPGSSVDVGSIAQLQAFRASVYAKWVNAEDLLAHHQRRVAEARAALVKCSEREKALESKQKDMRQQWERELNRSEERMLEELSMYRTICRTTH